MTESNRQRRWVLDTNLLVSRLLVPSGPAARAVDHALDRGILLVSEATLDELVQVLSRPKFDPYISQAERQQFIRLLGGIARFVAITTPITACRDPKDDKFLEVAVHGEAHAIVTGDADLLDLDPFHGIRILRPADLLAQR
ncbi:putative toxin-antitoxin system toxin component, PIN family [Thioalkalivibrio sp. ALE30]|uniref:putative toxin-antitoxin system toxin component, PIN family n=1 Tax=Thioalkalivibrio sp. ALE30 TaxID=1158181 RepID=UPI000378DEB5|nr:putative toxin-antitoxin system toxin component, PIN family [Thioalkalivibrio sp. ALE30]